MNHKLMTYRREIDGLRALAVIPVILFHAGFQIFSGGFVGVDVFFVISGYLITSIILAEKQAGNFKLINFYERRARRILPALFFVMFACLPFSWLFLHPADMKSFSQSLVAVPGFVSNVLFWRTTGYFETSAELKPLLHTWSLAVEEQYYLLFPVFILLAWKLGRRWIVVIISILAITSLAFAQWGSINKPEFTFFMLPTRGWEILVGALTAFFLSTKSSHKETSNTFEYIASTSGLLLIIYSIFAFDKNTPFPSIYTLFPTIGTALIITFASQHTFTGKVLGNQLLVGIGLISYSAYLWHQPLFAFARHAGIRDSDSIIFLILAVTSLMLGFLSWKFVEKPFRNKKIFTRKDVFLWGAFCSVFFMSLGLLGWGSKSFENYYIEHRLTDSEKEIYQALSIHTGVDMNMVDNRDCHFWSENITPDFEQRFALCEKKYGRGLLVIGDSHGMNIYNAIANSDITRFVAGVSKGGCRPHDNYAYCHYKGIDKFIEKNSSLISLVIFHQSGSYFMRDKAGRIDSPNVFESDGVFTLASENIEKNIRYLNFLSQFTDVVWLGPFVEARVDFTNYKLFINGFYINPKSLSHFAALEIELKNTFLTKPQKFKYVSLYDILAIQSDFLKVDSCITYRDIDHFSQCGEVIVGKKISEAFNAGYLQ